MTAQLLRPATPHPQHHCLVPLPPDVSCAKEGRAAIDVYAAGLADRVSRGRLCRSCAVAALLSSGMHRAIADYVIRGITEGRLDPGAHSEILHATASKVEDLMMREDYFDIARLKESSLCAWLRANLSKTVLTTLRSRSTRPEGNSIPLELSGVGTTLKAPLVSSGIDLGAGSRGGVALADIAFEHAMNAISPEECTRKVPLTDLDRIHIAGESLAILHGFRVPPLMVLHRERELVRGVLLADETAAARSLARDDADIPTALTDMWCGYTLSDRQTLAESPVAAHHIALHLVSPYSCRRKDSLRKFFTNAREASSSPKWRRKWRVVAKAFAAAFLDSAALSESFGLPEPSAWDDLVQDGTLESLAPTNSRAVSLLLGAWIAARDAKTSANRQQRAKS